MEIEDVSGTIEQGGEASEAPSLRDTLMEAVDTHSEGAGGAEPTPSGEQAGGEGEEQPGKPVASVTERARDGQGRFAKGSPAKEAPPRSAKPAQAPAKPGEVRQGDAPAYKPPQSWKPAAREALTRADPVVQQEVARREREISQAFQQTAEARRTADRFTQTMAPYQAFIRAEGSDDFTAVDNMMRTAVALRTLPAQPKAEMMARLCHQFGVNPGMLDEAWQALVQGRVPPQAQPQQRAQPQQFRDPRLDPIIARLQQAESAEYQETLSERDKFAESHQFYNDVRLDMADIIEMRGKRGLSTSWDQAYDLACMANEDVRPLYEQVKAAERARSGRPGIQRARAAASSVRASPGIRTTQGADPTDLRALLEESMAESSSR